MFVGVGWVDEDMENGDGWWPGTSARDEWSYRPLDSGCMHEGKESSLPIDVTDQAKS